MDWLYTNLSYFTENQQRSLLSNLTEDVFASLDQSTQNDIRYLFTRLDSSVPSQTLAEIVDALIKTVLQGNKLFIRSVNEGASFTGIAEKEPGTYSSKKIVAREFITGQILTADDLSASNDSLDYLKFTDLPLSGDGIYKIEILLEIESGGVASGDAENMVGEVFLIVDSDIDSDGV